MHYEQMVFWIAERLLGQRLVYEWEYDYYKELAEAKFDDLEMKIEQLEQDYEFLKIHWPEIYWEE